MRAARDLRHGATLRVPAFGFGKLEHVAKAGIEALRRSYFLRFIVKDRVGIIAQLASVLAQEQISIDAVLQEPHGERDALPFVITVEPTTEGSLSKALEKMKGLEFLCEPPLALPIESALAG